MERLVELLHDGGPCGIALSDFIELFLYACRKVVVHDAGEVLYQEVGDHRTCVRRQQFSLFGSSDFGAGVICNSFFQQGNDVVGTLFSGFVTFLYILALLDGGDGGGIGGRASDAQFFQLAHQACLRVAGRMLGEAFGCCNILIL